MDLFGFDTEDELKAWVVKMFHVRKGVEVTDLSRLHVAVEELYEDGCCEVCWEKAVRLTADYEGNSIAESGTYYYGTDMGMEFNHYE